MEAEVRSYEFSEGRSLYDRLYRNNQGSLLLKFFEYLFQGEIIYLRGRLLISGGDIFICLCYSCVICLLPSALSDRKFISIIYVFVIIKKGEIVRTRFVLINILSFDDNIVYEFCIRQCGTLILCIFHFRKYIKSMHKFSVRSNDSEGSVCNIRTCSRKTSEDGQAESEHGLLKHQKNLRSEAEEQQFLWYHARSSSR